MRTGYFLSCEEYPRPSCSTKPAGPNRPGFESLWISDHYRPRNDAQGQSPFVWSMIGAISQVCDLPITTAVTCPTIRQRAGGAQRVPAQTRRNCGMNSNPDRLTQIIDRLRAEDFIPPVRTVAVASGGIIRVRVPESADAGVRARLTAAMGSTRWELVERISSAHHARGRRQGRLGSRSRAVSLGVGVCRGVRDGSADLPNGALSALRRVQVQVTSFFRDGVLIGMQTSRRGCATSAENNR
jgi:hypothetical protein